MFKFYKARSAAEVGWFILWSISKYLHYFFSVAPKLNFVFSETLLLTNIWEKKASNGGEKDFPTDFLAFVAFSVINYLLVNRQCDGLVISR